MSAAGNRNRQATAGCATHGLGEFILRARCEQRADARAVELRVNVVNPDFALATDIKIRSKREESGRSNEFASRQHRGLTLPDFREADQFASREWEIAWRRIQGAQIVLIENSYDLPRTCESRDAASLESPDKRLAPPAQPPVNQPALFLEPDSPVSARFHESESEPAAAGAEPSRKA